MAAGESHGGRCSKRGLAHKPRAACPRAAPPVFLPPRGVATCMPCQHRGAFNPPRPRPTARAAAAPGVMRPWRPAHSRAAPAAAQPATSRWNSGLVAVKNWAPASKLRAPAPLSSCSSREETLPWCCRVRNAGRDCPGAGHGGRKACACCKGVSERSGQAEAGGSRRQGAGHCGRAVGHALVGWACRPHLPPTPRTPMSSRVHGTYKRNARVEAQMGQAGGPLPAAAAATATAAENPGSHTCWLRRALAAASPATPPPTTATLPGWLPAASDTIVRTGESAKRAIAAVADAGIVEEADDH